MVVVVSFKVDIVEVYVDNFKLIYTNWEIFSILVLKTWILSKSLKITEPHFPLIKWQYLFTEKDIDRSLSSSFILKTSTSFTTLRLNISMRLLVPISKLKISKQKFQPFFWDLNLWFWPKALQACDWICVLTCYCFDFLPHSF